MTLPNALLPSAAELEAGMDLRPPIAYLKHVSRKWLPVSGQDMRKNKT
jgi:hypothetical protein